MITLYYYEELTLREIGEVLGVTESRVSQLHTKAILRLKARLAGTRRGARRRRGADRRADGRPPISDRRHNHAYRRRIARAWPLTSPERSATSPSSATAGPGRRPSSRRCSSSRARVNRLGTVEQGTTVSDWDEDEQRRQMSLSASLATLEWQGRKINLIDTPGRRRLPGRRDRALRVVEGALVVVSGVMGVEVGTARLEPRRRTTTSPASWS